MNRILTKILFCQGAGEGLDVCIISAFVDSF